MIVLVVARFSTYSWLCDELRVGVGLLDGGRGQSSDSRGLETRQQLQRAEQMKQNPSGTTVPETQSVCTTQRISEGSQGGTTGHEA